jgi:hypothetical protein
MKSKIIFRAIGSFGGCTYRAIDRGDRIAIQESARGARWKDLADTTVSEFYKYADRFDLFNRYGSDPGTLWKIAEQICMANSLISECK